MIRILLCPLYSASDTVANGITGEQRSLYMLNGIHPTKAGYLEWWLPQFEKGPEPYAK